MNNTDANTPLLDPHQIRMLTETGGDDPAGLLHELWQLYADEIIPMLAALQALIEAHDAKAIHIAHAIAGSSANIGAGQLHQAARQLEADLQAGAWVEAKGACTALAPIYQATQIAFQKLLEGLVR
jgi:HPt (histidine-containing phosphotransfer) domain-containing protein